MDSADLEYIDKVSQVAKQYERGLLTDEEYFETLIVLYREWAQV